MLQAIRERSQGLIVVIIVGFIILTFALWGVESYINAGRRVVVAETDGEEIYLTEFQEHMQQFRRRAQSVLGDAFSDSDWNSPEMRQRALDQLVDDRIVKALIDDARIRISDRQVAMQLRQIPVFQDDNGFSRELYERALPQIGLSQAAFERQLRDDMAKAQLRAGIAASAFVTKQEARKIEQLREQKRDIGYAIITAASLDDEVTVSDAEIAAYYAAHKDEYRVPERVRLDYLEISAAGLQDDVRVSDADLRAFYDNNKSTYTAEEERNVNHILIHIEQGADEEAESAALAKAQSALERARQGESFEALAQELSDDVGSNTDGGETGMFARGVMAPEFEEAAFALEVGGISEPVRTKFGLHIIKLKAINPGGLRPFDDVRAEVEQAYRASEAQKMFFDQAEQFSNLVYEHPDGLEVAAESLGLEIRHTELMSEADIKLEFSDRVAARAFETEVLVEGLNAEPVELDDGRVVAIRVAEHKPSVVPPLTEVHAEVVAAAREEAERRVTQTAGDAIIERLRNGDSVDDAIKSSGYDWQHVAAAGRDSRDVNRAVLRAAFRADATGNEPAYIGVAIGKTDYAVVRVGDVTTPAAAAAADAEVAQIQQEIVASRAALTWQGFIDSLRAGSDVKVYAKNL